MNPERRPCAIILAAGHERRHHGRDRALLQLGPRTLVEEHIDAFRRAGIHEVAVVRRAGAADLPRRIGDVRVVMQPRDDASVFDSLVLGLFALERWPVLVLPVDNDLVGDDTLETLVGLARNERSLTAAVPRFEARNGHPVVLFRDAIDGVIRDASDPEGLHQLDQLLLRWAPRVKTVDVTDDAVTRDFDTPEDLVGRV